MLVLYIITLSCLLINYKYYNMLRLNYKYNIQLNIKVQRVLIIHEKINKNRCDKKEKKINFIFIIFSHVFVD